MKIIKILLLLSCLLPIAVLGQGKKVVYGVVSDDLGALPGASVYLQTVADQRAWEGVATTINGGYVLNILNDKEYEIVFSFIGYQTQTIPYKGQKEINVTLRSDTEIETITIEGTQRDGMGMDTKLVSSAVEKLDLSAYEDMAVSSVTDMMQGKMANVDIVAGGGAPGSKPSIRIRGTASLTGDNDPLIVIDGVPQSVTIDDGFNFSTANEDDFGALLNMSPSDIESITVLKDAAATAMWGEQASNGVLVVTRKKGVKGPPTFQIKQIVKTGIEPARVPMLNGEEYVTLMQDAIWNRVRDDEFAFSSLGLLSEFKDILYDPAYTYFNEFNQDVDWLDLVRRTPISSETNFNMSGGGDKVTYRFSANYLNEVGTTIGEDYSRINAYMNVGYRFSEKFNISSSFSYVDGDRSSSVVPTRDLALRKMPNMTPYLLDENGNMTDEYFNQPTTTIQGSGLLDGGDANKGNIIQHPVAVAELSTSNFVEKKSVMDFNATYRPIAGLQVRGLASLTLTNTLKQGYLPAAATNAAWNSERYNKSEEHQGYTMDLYTSVNASYYKKITDKHAFTVSVKADMKNSNNASQWVVTSGNNGLELSDPTVGGVIRDMGGSIGEYRNIGLVGSLNINFFDERYNIEATASTGGSSSSGRNSRWGINPVFGVNYNMQNEEFIKEVEWINRLILRASWGYTPKGATGNNTYGGIYGALDEQYQDMGALIPLSIQLNNIDFERIYQSNVSLELAVLENKLTFTANYYIKTTENLLQKDMRIPSSSGFSSIAWFNDGSVQNKGWETSLTGSNLLGQRGKSDWNFGFNINVSRNENVVLDLPTSLEYQKPNISNGAYANKIVEGRPLGAFYGFDYIGVYDNYDETVATDANGNVIKDVNGDNVVTTINGRKQRPGDAEYRDLNYDGVIDQYDIIYLGNSMPIINGGGSLSLSWKNLTLTSAVQFRIGQSVINQSRYNSENMGGQSNQSTAVLRRWRHEGDPTDIPRALWGTNYNSLGSNRFVEIASFLKVKDLTLSYRLPSTFAKKLAMNDIRLVFTCYNPFTFSNYMGQDPEVSLPDGFNNLAMDNSLTPNSRTFAGSVTISF